MGHFPEEGPGEGAQDIGGSLHFIPNQEAGLDGLQAPHDREGRSVAVRPLFDDSGTEGPEETEAVQPAGDGGGGR